MATNVSLTELGYLDGLTGPIGAWTAFTPTGFWTTNTTYTGFYKRVGDDLHVKVRLAFAGAPNVGSFYVDLPAGFTIDTAKVLSTIDNAIQGTGAIMNTSVSTHPLTPIYRNTTSVSAYVHAISGSFVVLSTLSASNPFSIGNTDAMELYFTVPVV